MAMARYEAEYVDASPLGKPLKFEFSGLTAKNRFMKGAMAERLASWDPKDYSKRGIPSQELINVYRHWGAGEFGVLLTGNFMLEPDQLEAAGDAIIPRGSPFSGERFEAFKKLADESKRDGSLIIAQVSHPGRQTPQYLQPHPISASDIQLERNDMGLAFAKPKAMNKADIERVIEGFAHAAEYCYKAGFHGVQLHGAHGYLLAQFLSPSTNKREDQYGGSLLNRARLILEIADAIHARVPDKSFSLSIKVNSVEFQDGGFSTEDCQKLCGELEQKGFDFVELSGGTYEELAFSHKRESTKKREAFFLEFADTIVRGLSRTRTYVVGGLRTVPAMVKALQSVDGVGLARPACHEFDLPRKILQEGVKSAVKCELDEQDFRISSVAAGTQIRLVGNEKQPLDLTQDKYVENFKKSFKKWAVEMANNESGSKYGYVDMEGVELQPFGAAYGT